MAKQIINGFAGILVAYITSSTSDHSIYVPRHAPNQIWDDILKEIFPFW